MQSLNDDSGADARTSAPTAASSERSAAPDATSSETVLSAVDVTLRYRPKAQDSKAEAVTALHDVTLEVPPGQFVALVGASGCGKTSLLNLFAGLVRPTHGPVRVNGKLPACPPPGVGYMFARDGLLPWRRVERNVVLGLEDDDHWSRRTARARAHELLDMVGLGGFEKAYPRQLSHGMRQRAALARTLAPDPSVLLMDEPFAALDAQTKLRLQGEFLRILEQAEVRKTVLFVTHDLQEALLLADRVVVMLPRPGRIATDQWVDLPRNRTEDLAELMFDPAFRELHEELFHQLQEGER